MDKDPWMKVSVENSAPFISRFGCGQISICFQYCKFKNIKQNIHLQMYASFPTPVFRNIFVMILNHSKACHPEFCHFGTLIILSCRHLKISKCRDRLSLSSPQLHKDKRNSTVINLFS